MYTSVTTTSSGNVLDSFDKYMTYYYNFDTMGYDRTGSVPDRYQFEMLNSYLLLCSYYQYGDQDTSTIQNLTSQFEKAQAVSWSKRRFSAEQMETCICMPPRKHFTSRESISYWNNGTKFTWTDSVISEFNSRMHGKTVEQELEMIGYEKSNDRDKVQH